ncbi:heterogeneous nuclear ribonucleoprotein Q-like [Camellia sinensis]|uniref:heterogeneous nuclear ribonucleoprotein Q-like n=1 Tax=Camellia sinensis TaxID=4442 RepID=UPI00103641D8|nr:heterogeneous nuclear ribonucleoprotein Q-like [Camellia sinensis]XP_028119543.1 heterogeneous nuclear ribonucleoprotein Q-like [Camellia sinensis]
MPRTRARAAAAKSDEPEKPTEPEKRDDSEERVDFDGDNDLEETVEEEVEYEEVEVEEEVEEDEEEEVEEEVEEEEDEEEEEDGEEDTAADGADVQKGSDGDEDMKPADAEGDVEKKHAELLALPPHGSEVYLGGIPQDASEEDLRNFCESVGEVVEVRIMKEKDSSENKGYAFVTFRTKEFASKAIKELNNTELKGKKIKCSTSQAKHKLFIGNVPRNWGEENMKKVVTKIGPGVIAVELLKDPQNPTRNRGFAFVEYYNHACAEYSRQNMSKPEFKLDDNAPTVSWADPKNVDSSATSQVKAVYVKNLPKNITQDQLRELFEYHGKITKVVLPPAKAGHEKNRYGFVHFAERSNALKALKNTEKYEIDGQVLECSLAKPQLTDQKSSGASNSQKSALLPRYPPGLGYGLVGGAYGALGAGYGAAGFGQPPIYGRGPPPGGMPMMPMLLPDGRIGYVFQQPGAQPYSSPPPQQRSGRSGGSSGGSRSGGRRSSDRGHGGRSRYNPY